MRFYSSIIILSLLLAACAIRKTSEAYYHRIYKGQYDAVWLATLRALSDYPLKLSNKDAGRIQTEVIKDSPYNELMFTYPGTLELPERFRFSLKFNFAKLASEDEDSLVRIRVVKELERLQDFYVGYIPSPSDGLEERVLLYRIEHILRMERRLSKQED